MLTNQDSSGGAYRTFPAKPGVTPLWLLGCREVWEYHREAA